MKPRLCFYGIFFVLGGIALGMFAILTGAFLVHEILFVHSCGLIFTGVWLIWFDVVILLPYKRRRGPMLNRTISNPKITAVLTAYKDAESIGLAVQDFRKYPAVKRVIVVDNNSRDMTFLVARRCGAETHIEYQAGYGHCAYRCLSEAAIWSDTDFVVFAQGDCTYRAADIDKLLAFAPHADIVGGTRIVEQLRERDTQLNSFIYYGNFFVGKLLEAKHLGKGTFTDVGADYKLCSSEALRRLLPLLNPDINMAFNAHFLDTALTNNFAIVECPITFHNRVGQSKGGGRSNWSGFKVGMQMIFGLLFGWQKRKTIARP